jgi:ribose 1,5-bisphosphokinase
MKRGRLFFVVGPSGAGKDTLIAGAIAADPSLIWARRCITRPEQAGGEPFEGLPDAEFDARLAAGTFALHWAAHGLRYGVPHTALAPLAQGRDVLLNGSRGAIDQARAALPDMAVILITAPESILAQRLAARGRESAGDIAQRLERASFALPSGVYAVEVINDATPEMGAARLRHAIRG